MAAAFWGTTTSATDDRSPHCAAGILTRSKNAGVGFARASAPRSISDSFLLLEEFYADMS
jgi:hypothetical protein